MCHHLDSAPGDGRFLEYILSASRKPYQTWKHVVLGVGGI